MGCICLYSYIKPQLTFANLLLTYCCICLYSYIKPQLDGAVCLSTWRCICLYSYIKPQLVIAAGAQLAVVYVSIPTSNHNSWLGWPLPMMVVYVSIPTSNHNGLVFEWNVHLLYMSLFLHQTTTLLPIRLSRCCCICLYSYIKPQHIKDKFVSYNVVYVSIPTSNHNRYSHFKINNKLYMSLFLHQTTTWCHCAGLWNPLYMSLFLHQTTTW